MPELWEATAFTNALVPGLYKLYLGHSDFIYWAITTFRWLLTISYRVLSNLDMK